MQDKMQGQVKPANISSKDTHKNNATSKTEYTNKLETIGKGHFYLPGQ